MTGFETAFETIGLDLPGGAFQALAAGTGRPVLYLHGLPGHFLFQAAPRAVAARVAAWLA